MVDGHADALRGLRAIYIDSGKRDQFFLDLGAEAFRRALERIGVTDVFFELFDGTHSAHRVPLPDRAALSRRAAPADVGRVPQVLRHVAALRGCPRSARAPARGTRSSSSTCSSAGAA